MGPDSGDSGEKSPVSETVLPFCQPEGQSFMLFSAYVSQGLGFLQWPMQDQTPTAASSS